MRDIHCQWHVGKMDLVPLVVLAVPRYYHLTSKREEQERGNCPTRDHKIGREEVVFCFLSSSIVQRPSQKASAFRFATWKFCPLPAK